uniref:Uncharacterized protein n=1 Tax=Rhizophora mucronata TaxID=61149 RepID=A0A2P2IKB0_RHIMU
MSDNYNGGFCVSGNISTVSTTRKGVSIIFSYI